LKPFGPANIINGTISEIQENHFLPTKVLLTGTSDFGIKLFPAIDTKIRKLMAK